MLGLLVILGTPFLDNRDLKLEGLFHVIQILYLLHFLFSLAF